MRERCRRYNLRLKIAAVTAAVSLLWLFSHAGSPKELISHIVKSAGVTYTQPTGPLELLNKSMPVLLNKSLPDYDKEVLLAMQWEGFGPEKGLYNFTVVTAMIDIGRGSWTTQTRSYDTYLTYMQHVLRLDINLIVFVDGRGRPFIEHMRRGRENHTTIIDITMRDLPDYKHRDRIAEIMATDSYKENNELVKNRLCESYIPEYDIMQWSKLYFMKEAMDRDPYNTSLFIWLDGGYTHGEGRVFPPDRVFTPNDVVLRNLHKVTFIERESVEKFRKDIPRLHKMSINIIAGLFFAGGKQALRRLYELQRELIAEWLKTGVVDDDQTTYMLMYYKEPALFNLVRGDWNDVFKLFNSHK